MSANASGRICILTDARHVKRVTMHRNENKEGAGSPLDGALGRVSRLCDALSCLKKVSGIVTARHCCDF